MAGLRKGGRKVTQAIHGTATTGNLGKKGIEDAVKLGAEEIKKIAEEIIRRVDNLAETLVKRNEAAKEQQKGSKMETPIAHQSSKPRGRQR